MKKSHNQEGWETNRYKKYRITRKSKFWCGVCDCELVGKGEKCEHSGNIGGQKKKLRKY